MAQNLIKKARGFTLIEILVVIGIIAILATIVIIAINPAKQFAQARDTQRESNVNTILNAIGQNIADNKGIFTCSTDTITTSTSTIGTTATAGFADLSCLVPTYIPSMVVDPNGGSLADTKYDVSVDAVGRYMVCAPLASGETSIPGAPPVCVKR